MPYHCCFANIAALLMPRVARLNKNSDLFVIHEARLQMLPLHQSRSIFTVHASSQYTCASM